MPMRCSAALHRSRAFLRRCRWKSMLVAERAVAASAMRFISSQERRPIGMLRARATGSKFHRFGRDAAVGRAAPPSQRSCSPSLRGSEAAPGAGP